MPINLPFHFPYYYRYPRFMSVPNSMPNHNKTLENSSTKKQYEKKNQQISNQNDFNANEQSRNSTDSSDYFFEILGLKLYFDDILIICILFFLYSEGVKDDNLFLSLLLLLLS